MQLSLPWRHHVHMAGRTSARSKEPFPNRVHALRTAAGLTQQELAAKMGVTTSAIGKLERGERRLRNDQIAKLASIMGIHQVEVLIALSAEEREALQLFGAADAEMRSYMIDVLRQLVKRPVTRTSKAA